MKIYVDELPESCAECKCLGVFGWCNYLKDGVCDEIKNNKRHVLCPLATTQTLKQQVREEVVEEIKKRLAEQRTKMQDDTHCYPQTVVCWQDIVSILDQVKGE